MIAVRGRWVPFAVLLALVWAGSAAAAQTFTDVTSVAGVDYLQRLTPVFVTTFPEMAEMSTGGAAAGDVDGDGWVDLLVTRVDAPPILFRNDGAGGFEDVTAGAGDLQTALPLGGNGAAFGDIDNDGDLDLYVTSYGTTRFHLFLNQGGGIFSEEAVVRGAAIETPYLHFGMGVGFGDYDLDGYLDIFVSEWWHHPLPPLAPLPGVSHNRLLRNRGAAQPGFFDDVTVLAGIDVEDLPVPNDFAGTVGFGAGFSDFDLDGWPDLSWVGDLGTSRLLWNDGDGTFTDDTEAANVGLDRSGMGQVQADLDDDGLLDWFVTAIFQGEDEIQFGFSNQLYMNDGDRTFTNTTSAAGVAAGGWGWGASPIDYDHDGDIDLVHTNGWLDTDVPPRFANDRTVLFENDGAARFVEVGLAHGITDTALGRGLVVFDYDRDGDMDVFIANHGGPPVLYRNDGANASPWVQLEFEGTSSNRDGIGALVRLYPDGDDHTRVRTYQHLAYGSFVGRDELVGHFGLGALATPVRAVRVRWPSGVLQEVRDVPQNSRLRLVEPRSTGHACASDEECESRRCDSGACLAPSCTDGVRNQWEADVDCGGPCSVCAVGGGCFEDADCETGACEGWACVQPESCPDVTCFEATSSKLSLSRKLGVKDALKWTWRGRGGGYEGAFGAPTDATEYELSVVDAVGDLVRLRVPAGDRWRDKKRGYVFSDPGLAADGVRKLAVLTKHADDRIVARGRGPGLGVADRAPVSPVRARLTNSDCACWEVVFPEISWSGGRLVARNP